MMDGKVLLRLQPRFDVEGVGMIGIEPSLGSLRVLLESPTPPADLCMAIYASATSDSFTLTSPLDLVRSQKKQQKKKQQKKKKKKQTSGFGGESGDWLDDYFTVLSPVGVRAFLQACFPPTSESAVAPATPCASIKARRTTVSCVPRPLC